MENRIAEVRKELKLTQSSLAKMAGISRPCLSEIENRKSNPDGKNMLMIAKALGKKVDEIFLFKNVV